MWKQSLLPEETDFQRRGMQSCQLLPAEAGISFGMSVSFDEQMEGILAWWYHQNETDMAAYSFQLW